MGEIGDGMRTQASLSVLVVALLVLLIRSGDAVPHLAGAAYPGANGLIAFTSTADGDAEIYVMNADGSNVTRLTDNADDDTNPDWSPDGTQMAFTRYDGMNSHIWVMDASGSGQTQLTAIGDNEEPTWSPDGLRIAFDTNRNGNDDIYVINADGSGVAPLTMSLDHESEASWSPDGAKIAYNRAGDVWVMDSDGTNAVDLTNEPGTGDFNPDWSPDGEKIAFASNRGDSVDVYVMDRDGSNVTNLTNVSMSDGRPVWSPDGTMISYYRQIALDNTEVWVMNADGSEKQNLTNAAGDQDDPSWQPLAGDERVWGDDNCSGFPDPVDSLLTLRHDAGLSAETGACPDIGQVVEVQAASPHPWGDVDCSGTVTPVDSLKLLRYDAGLSVAQELDCPEIGSAVLIIS
jgi:TolB protein